MGLGKHVLGALLAAVVPIVGWGSAGTGATPKPAGNGASRSEGPVALPREDALPDSVLAMIGRDRTITVGDLIASRQRTGPRALPDSITPQQAGEFLDFLVDRELLAVAALAEPPAWTPEDRGRLELVRDRLVLAAALDSALAPWGAAGGDTLDPAARRQAGLERAGAALRETCVTRLGVELDEALLERLAGAWRALPRPTADSSLGAQLRMLEAEPAIADADSDAAIARSRLGEYRVSDLLAAWRRLSPAYRPRIERAGELGELVVNGLFERMLRRQAERQGLERRPEIAAALEREREQIAVERYLEREVVAPLRGDSLGARRLFEAHPEDWAIPTRTRLLSLAFEERGDAERMATSLRDPAAAESLVARTRRSGVDYQTDVTARTDSAWFAAALRAGTGAVIGPERSAGAWRVARVLAVLPGRPARFDEVRRRVEERWYAEEGRRRVDELRARLRARVPVRINSVALSRLGSRPRP